MKVERASKDNLRTKRDFCKVLDLIGLSLTLLIIAIPPLLALISLTWNKSAITGLTSMIKEHAIWLTVSAMLYTSLCLLRMLLCKNITRWNVFGCATLWVLVIVLRR